MEPAGGQMTLFSLAGSRDLVNPTAQPESGLAKTMNATYGPRCLERYGRLAPDTLWAKTFPALLVGMEGWCSMRCKLIWKLRGTKSSRLYFQLQVSALPTEGIESGLLPTPSAQEDGRHPKDGWTLMGNYYKNGEGKKIQTSLSVLMRGNLLPTPRTTDVNAGREVIDGTQNNFIRMNADKTKRMGANLADVAHKQLPTPRASANENRQTKLSPSQMEGKHGLSLAALAEEGLLPTPPAQDGQKNASLPPSQVNRNDSIVKRILEADPQAGKTSQLNPRFVLEMMGFQPNHCDSAFEKIAWAIYQKKKSTKSFQQRLRSGETKPSKQQETP